MLRMVLNRRRYWESTRLPFSRLPPSIEPAILWSHPMIRRNGGSAVGGVVTANDIIVTQSFPSAIVAYRKKKENDGDGGSGDKNNTVINEITMNGRRVRDRRRLADRNLSIESPPTGLTSVRLRRSERPIGLMQNSTGQTSSFATATI